MARLTLRPLRRADAPAVRRLVQLYIYDLVGEHWGVEADGTFGSRAWHRRFWSRRGRHHFVIRVDGKLAGFALVRDGANFGTADDAHEISEFFVLRRYRRRGVGAGVARMLFSRFPGAWEVAQLSWNVPARRFWRDVIRRCAVGPVRERQYASGDLRYIVQHFTTARARTRPRR